MRSAQPFVCGICGIVLTEPGVASDSQLRSLLDRMTDSVSHRGPDDRGVQFFGDGRPSSAQPVVGIGHRRLSIIDVAGGHQPLCNEAATAWVVYNGEIYNFPDLRAGLVAAGHTMRTRSDTECVVHLYEEKGARLVEALRGVFAFALWDERRKELTLARDRLGHKPLFYLYDPARGLFAFASELKALVQIPGFDRTVSAQALDHYLTLQYVPHPLCMFSAVRKLPPAHTLTYQPARGRLEVRRYWRPDFAPDYGASQRALKEELRATLAEATRIQLISDVPLGAFLSGGIDSSITVALMSRMLSEPVRTFSIGFEERRYDETRYARLVARHCRTRHHEEVVRPSALQMLPELVWHYDEPFGDSSAIPTYYVSQVARKHVKVVLGGDGGDECFGGYPRYAAVWIGTLFDRLPGPVRWVAAPGFWSRLPVSMEAKTIRRRLQRLMLDLNLPPEQRYLDWVSVFRERQRLALYSPGLRQATRGDGPEGFLRRYYAEVPDGDFIHRTTYVDLMTYLPCDGLNKVDIASMAHGLETRAPFLDHKVVELAGRIPRRLKMRPTLRGFEGKLVLKETFADLLPRPILVRRKMGFGVPIAAWFRGELRELVRDIVLSRTALERGYFEKAQLQRLVDDHIRGVRDHGYRLWTLLMLELWHRRFVDGEAQAL